LSGTGTIGEIADGAGRFVFVDVPSGEYELSVSADGYYPSSLSIEILPNTTSYQDIQLDPKEPPVDPEGTVSGYVFDKKTDKPIKRARVHIVELDRMVLTDDNGFYKFTLIPPGNYTIEIEASNYKKVTSTFELLPQEEEQLNFYPKKVDKDERDMEDLYGLSIVALCFGLILLIILLLLRRVIKRKMARAKELEEEEEQEEEDKEIPEDEDEGDEASEEE
jgi:hypothetical protein